MFAQLLYLVIPCFCVHPNTTVITVTEVSSNKNKKVSVLDLNDMLMLYVNMML